LLSNMFSKNIADYKDELIVTEAEVEGLDDAYKDAHRQEAGTYKIDLSYPSYRPFMRLSKSDEARKKLYMKYTNRASDKNLVILEKLILNRTELAELLGYKTFAEYRLVTRMAKTPKTVWDFENGLIEKVQEKGKSDYEEVLQVKRNLTGNDTVRVVNSWEYGYYSNILKRDKYKVDSEKVKEYFEINNVMDGLFSITQSLFGLQYKEVENPSVWHEDVRLFEVFDNDKLIGRFYLDLYPRDNKYRHAACFGFQKGRLTSEGYQVPTATLECNFPQATDSSPALMSHGQVNTFFHEFGHVLHTLLTQSELDGFSGTSVSRDFVEAPSQIFENWTWDYPSLKMFAKHYKTGEVLPKDLYDKMMAAKNVGSGVGTLAQIFYGTIDMTIHDKYQPHETRTTTDIVKELQNKILLTPFVEGTHFQAAFGHLTGYAASYYGYLWSKVYAQDMFSVFENEGILNPDVGKRYRKIILARGADQEAIELVKEFLGRSPNPRAFYKSLGLPEEAVKEINKKAGL
jgi:oligopeptidase A